MTQYTNSAYTSRLHDTAGPVGGAGRGGRHATASTPERPEGIDGEGVRVRRAPAYDTAMERDVKPVNRGRKKQRARKAKLDRLITKHRSLIDTLKRW